MARARNIKPGLYKNEDLAECSIWARYIFPGMWMLADREGRLEDRPKRIKGELLAYDSVDVDPLLVELAKFGFILRYEVDGNKYIQILKFAEHQTPHVREQASTIPAPEGLLEGITKVMPSTSQGSAESLPRSPDSLIPSSLITDSLIPDTKEEPAPQAASAKAPKFSFAARLFELGADEKSIRDWLAVRKVKRAANTEAAIDLLVQEAEKAQISVADAVKLCAQKSWQGFEAKWLKPQQQGAPVQGGSKLGVHGQATANAAQRWLEGKNAA